jgi:hypothetical protein
VAAMDDGGYGWHSSDTRWHGDGVGRRDNGKEVRWRLRGAVVLEDARWSSTELERRGRRSGARSVRRRGRWKTVTPRVSNPHDYVNHMFKRP